MKNIVALILVVMCLQQTDAQTNIFPSSGNVGIGTSNPLLKLSVDAPHGEAATGGVTQNGILRLQTAQSVGWGEVMDFGMHIGIYGPPSYAWIQATNKDNLVIKYNLSLNPNGGNVGIGTTSPLGTLDLGNNTGLKFLYYGNGGNTGYIAGIGLNLTNSTNVINNVVGGSISANSGTGTWAVTRGDGTYPYSSYTDLFTIDSRSGNANFITGNVGIGTASPSEKLSVNGNIRSKKIIVTQNGWADYVFNDGYRLRPLNEIEKFIKTNKHLPDIPTAKEVEKNGIDLGDNQALLLKKIEELTMYMIEQNKRMDAMKKDNEATNKKLLKQQKEINLLRKQTKK